MALCRGFTQEGIVRMSKAIKVIFIMLLLSSLAGCASVKSNTLTITDAPSDMKIYKYEDYGYEIAYPKDYEVQISGGHSPIANPELGTRLSLFSKNNPGLDIDSIDKLNFKDKYQNIEEYINYKHLDIKPDEDFNANDKNNKIYKLDGDNYYFSFFENDKYIFQLSSNSKTLLKKVMENFKHSSDSE